MISFKEIRKNKHLTDYPEIREVVVSNYVRPRRKTPLQDLRETDQNMLKDF